jgi:predicted PurR-regulated permease PerM
VIGTVVGLAPHVLHHIGLLAGTALIAGTSGTVLFGVAGLAASIPLLQRLRRRFRTWWAPVVGLAVFAAMFSLSAFVTGPAIGGGGELPSDQPSPSRQHTDHPLTRHPTMRRSASASASRADG